MTLKELRKDKLKLTQREFAKTIGTCLSSVSKYENGIQKLPRQIKAKILQVYGVEVEEVKVEHAELKAKIEQLKQENAELKKQIRFMQLTSSSAKRAEKLFHKLREIYGWRTK